MDGLPGTFELRRGDHFRQVEQAVRSNGHPRSAVIYTIDRNTADGIEPFLGWVRASKLPVMGVMFYFHTPYYGYDDLYLGAEEGAAPLIDRLLGCIRAGMPCSTRAPACWRCSRVTGRGACPSRRWWTSPANRSAAGPPTTSAGTAATRSAPS